jgi:hypothetical protein
MEVFDDRDVFEGMEVTEDHPAAQFSPIPEDVIMRLVRKGIISLPPKPEQQPVFEVLKEVWGDDWYMRNMVSKVRKRDREMLVYFPLLGRVEKYVLNIYLNDKKRIMVEDVQAKIKKSYGTTFPRERILAIRNIAKRYKGRHETNAEKERILLQGIKV